MCGTARYVSIATHNGYEQSRRDDLESISYILLCFLRPNLPWMGLPGKNMTEKKENIRNMKISLPLE